MKGLVVKSTGSWYSVKCENEIVKCKIRGKLKLQGERSTNPIAVGDIVEFETKKDETAVIKKIMPRKNYIIRKSTNLSRKKHIIAANIDQVILLVTLAMPETTLQFIDRFLVTAEIYKIPAKLVFNKIDIYSEEIKLYMNALIKEYEKIGYDCFKISATKNINLDEIKNLLNNKISVLSGNSGVGKSTLINQLDSNLELQTDEISEYHQSGKHTTTFAEMFDLQSGGSIIDTPGIKGFGTVDMTKEDISHNFPEIFALLPNCKFHNCTHTHEPECAVKQAVENNEIVWWRYKNYLSMLEGEDDKYREDIYRPF